MSHGCFNAFRQKGPLTDLHARLEATDGKVGQASKSPSNHQNLSSWRC